MNFRKFRPSYDDVIDRDDKIFLRRLLKVKWTDGFLPTALGLKI